MNDDPERRFAADCPHVCLEDVKVQAFVAPLEHVGGFRGGPVLDEAHRIFRHHRDHGPFDVFAAGAAYPHRLPGAFTYAGPYYDHFGHFMSEMIHRIVPARMMGLPARYLFVATELDMADRGFDALPGYMRDVLAFCGVGRDDVLVINRNTVVERLHFVQQAASLATYPKPGYLDALRAFTTRRLDALHGGEPRPERLYVSRSAFSKVGGFLGESYVEERFREAGFTIFRPERHGITVQMDHYRKARSVVFSGGSACHGTELLGRRMMNAVAYIPRHDFQVRLFDRVLRPRALTCASVDLSSYLGTLIDGIDDGKPAPIRGVSVFDLDKTAAWLAATGSPLPRKPSAIRYALAAARDIAGYRSEIRGSIERNGTFAATLVARMLIAVIRARRGAGPDSGQDSGQDTGQDHDPARGRPRMLTDREIGEIWAACAETPAPFGPFFRFAVLTLQPHPLVAALRWPDLSGDLRSWTIPADRTQGVPLVVPLPREAREGLASLSREGATEFVFQRDGKPLNRFGQAKEALDARIAQARREAAEREPFPPWSLSDLRVAGLQRLEELGYDRAAIRALLGFAKPDERRSARRIDEPAADPARMLETWAGEIAAMRRTLRRHAPGGTEDAPLGTRAWQTPTSRTSA